MKQGLRDTARHLAERGGVTVEQLAAGAECAVPTAAQTLSHLKRMGELVATPGADGRLVYTLPPKNRRRNPDVAPVKRRPRAKSLDPRLDRFAEWLVARFADHTVRMYVARVREALRHPEGPEAWLRARLTKSTPARTATVYTAAVRAWGEFSGETIDDSGLPRGVISRNATVEPLTEPQIAEILDQLRDAPLRVYTIVALLIYTGARISELCELRKSGIITRGSELSLVFVGKGGVKRELPVVGVAAGVLGYWMTTEDYTSSRAWVFVGSKNKAVHPETVRRVLRPIEVNGRRLHPHVFRHTAATLMIAHGVDLPTVRDILGHASISTTGLYAHSTDRSRREALDKLAAGLAARAEEEDF